MDSEEQKSKDYLEELYRQTGGDVEVQVSMYDVGAAIGLDKSEAGSLAEQLMVQGQTELRTLAGGISITAEGLTALGISTPRRTEQKTAFISAKVQLLTRLTVTRSIFSQKRLKTKSPVLALSTTLLEEIVLDLKTIEVHMLSPRPKVPVLREIFRSLQATLEKAKADKSAAQLATILS